MTDRPDTMPPLPPSPVEVCDLVLLSREHVQALGWKNREALYPASQVHAYARQHAEARCAALVEALRDLEAMAERYRPLGAPIPDAQKKVRTAIAAHKEKP